MKFKQNNRYSYLKEIFYLAGESKRSLAFIFVLFLILTIIELIGIGLIAPYISFVVGVDSGIEKLDSLLFFINVAPTRENTLIILGVILITVFFLKTIIAYIANARIITFVQNKRVDLTKKLMGKYLIIFL